MRKRVYRAEVHARTKFDISQVVLYSLTYGSEVWDQNSCQKGPYWCHQIDELHYLWPQAVAVFIVHTISFVQDSNFFLQPFRKGPKKFIFAWEWCISWKPYNISALCVQILGFTHGVFFVAAAHRHAVRIYVGKLRFIIWSSAQSGPDSGTPLSPLLSICFSHFWTNAAEQMRWSIVAWMCCKCKHVERTRIHLPESIEFLPDTSQHFFCISIPSDEVQLPSSKEFVCNLVTAIHNEISAQIQN